MIAHVFSFLSLPLSISLCLSILHLSLSLFPLSLFLTLCLSLYFSPHLCLQRPSSLSLYLSMPFLSVSVYLSDSLCLWIFFLLSPSLSPPSLPPPHSLLQSLVSDCVSDSEDVSMMMSVWVNKWVRDFEIQPHAPMLAVISIWHPLDSFLILRHWRHC